MVHIGEGLCGVERRVGDPDQRPATQPSKPLVDVAPVVWTSEIDAVAEDIWATIDKQ
jgi:hypothetical protein